MQSRNLLNLGLLTLLVILLSIVFWPTAKTIKIDESKLSHTLQSEKINQISIQRLGYASIELYKEDDIWWSQQPRLPARENTINQLLELLSSQSQTRYAETKMNLNAIGLNKPSLCIEYNQQPICFGDRNALNQLRYLQLEGQVHMIYDTLSHQISGEPHDYISLRLLPVNNKITALNLPELDLHKQQGKWQLAEAYSVDQLQQLLDHWQSARALTIKAYQGGDVEELIKITLNNQQTIEFQMLSSEPELILARPELGIQYHLSEGSLARLTRLPNLLFEE